MGAYALILRMCWRGALLEEGTALCLLARKVEQVAGRGVALIPVNVLRSLRFSTNWNAQRSWCSSRIEGARNVRDVRDDGRDQGLEESLGQA